jgi:pimeloyl-ACP methyl ester carboxylesterase
MLRQTPIVGIAVLAMMFAGCGGQNATEVETVAAPATGPGIVSSSDGIEIAYTVNRIGTPNLVLVHGWMGDQSYWNEQVPVLAEAFGVVTVDLAGHGASGLGRDEWSIPSLGNDVKAVVDKLGLKNVIVVGHSMGGYVALDVARKLPGTVVGVIGIDTLHDDGSSWDPDNTANFLSPFEQDFPAACSDFVTSMFSQTADAALVQGISDDMCSGPPEIGVALLGAYVAFDRQEAFSQSGVPIHAINTDKWPTDVEGNLELADFKLTLLEGYGHFLMQEAPEVLTRAVIDTTLEIVMGEDQSGPGP